MALKKAKKVELIKEYTDALKGAKSAVYVKFKGLPVKETMELRNSLYTENVHYSVVKKTLWNLAIKNVGITGDAPVVAEELAVVYGEDLLSPARVSYEFSKTHKDTFAILGGDNCSKRKFDPWVT
jgi:ribosomal protein L10